MKNEDKFGRELRERVAEEGRRLQRERQQREREAAEEAERRRRKG